MEGDEGGISGTSICHIPLPDTDLPAHGNMDLCQVTNVPLSHGECQQGKVPYRIQNLGMIGLLIFIVTD